MHVSDMEKTFVKQKDSHSCGPVALMNARIFQGYQESSDWYLELYTDLCKCKSPEGTKAKDFWWAARQLEYTRIYKPEIKHINFAMDEDNAVIINHGDQKRHYSLIVESGHDYFLIINHYFGGVVHTLHVQEFLKHVWIKPKLWLVRT